VSIANIHGVNIVYQVYGHEGPWLAINLGGRRGHEEMVPLARKISQQGFRVLLHDRRNTGASDILIAGEDGEEQLFAEDLTALMDHIHAKPAFICGTSSGVRISLLAYKRIPQSVLGLILIRVTGGELAATNLPQVYYADYISAAQYGGMAAVCDMPLNRERIKANPSNRERLMSMDPKEYIRVMSHWMAIFKKGPKVPVFGVENHELESLRLPVMVVPGNDLSHGSATGKKAAELIPGSFLFEMPLDDQPITLVPFTDWSEHEPLLADAIAKFMHQSISSQTKI